ncbi:hypothetical protein UFOVP1305_84 [uncultured Caudovirales phage]|uniref:Uncharacterized protein n=1 Tax=uncultured Caudovirales phage TaxID=2100421 RepID=A0A6J5PED1_9CAUD|nr:hypothetical protein UFOVP896_29 [uncultured Caudovirales phage]CAB4198409.1 hypothetical protein UFOVP1305_84 [uncultured Caudovirales phage]
MTDDILADRWQTHLARCHDLLASEWAKAIAAAQEYLSGDDLKRDEADNLSDSDQDDLTDRHHCAVCEMNGVLTFLETPLLAYRKAVESIVHDMSLEIAKFTSVTRAL